MKMKYWTQFEFDIDEMPPEPKQGEPSLHIWAWREIVSVHGAPPDYFQLIDEPRWDGDATTFWKFAAIERTDNTVVYKIGMYTSF